MASDQMDVDVPVPSWESLSASSSFEKLDLENINLVALGTQMKTYSTVELWAHRLILAGATPDLFWPPLISTILVCLTAVLSKTDIKDSIITTPSMPIGVNLVNSFTDEELEEWKTGARKGIESNDWKDLITHRAYLSDYQMVSPLIPNPSKDPKTKILECSFGCPSRIEYVVLFPHFILLLYSHPTHHLLFLRGWYIFVFYP